MAVAKDDDKTGKEVEGVVMQEKGEEESVERAAKLAPKLIYEVIRRDGEEELQRTNRALVWSGIAAGIMISFSVVGEAILRTYLPEAPLSYLIENMGYSLGFLVVILGRMQLFTENTITTVLPVIHAPTWGLVAKVARLWGIVLFANVVGAFAVASLFAFTAALPDEIRPAMMELSQHATGFSTSDAFFRAIPAGVLVAAIVWMLPQAESAAFFVIGALTWLIAAGDFSHIVAGSVEMAYLMVQGELAVGDGIMRFFLPVLAGNIVGGTAIFSLMAYGQVKDDIGKQR
ncbi:formate/nitrite transporter family protein [Flavimaricola marinus]|uniref:Inner membrane protein YfdC n=1 Tax=Flavimaricola marinus TaxID=1819565 RepID=A0A238LKP0_9RHOB|nr:formate/nitrite transporter family protein [Flavimaricola marinus]SMY10287.1 Inner membrane protein YfdC [Flavimaricola marinus]